MSADKLEIGKKSLLIVTGEPSGDQRAAEVLTCLKKQNPHIAVFGMGGDSLADGGAEITHDISETAVIGIWEAIGRIPVFQKIRRELIETCRRKQTGHALLVDFGGFNLRLAKSLQRIGVKVVYYVSPQLWASRPGRIRQVQKYVDLMLTLFAFEADYYRERGVEAVHVGHPLKDRLPESVEKPRVLADLGIRGEGPVIALMPGSRASEIKSILPVMLESAAALQKHGYKHMLLLVAPPVKEQVERIVRDVHGVTCVHENHLEALAACDVGIITSGTAALEAAALRIPSVVVYRTSWLTAFIAKLVMTVDQVSLPNIMLGEEVFPELLQEMCTPGNITREIRQLLEDHSRYDRIRARLRTIDQHLGTGNAAETAAQHIARFIQDPHEKS